MKIIIIIIIIIIYLFFCFSINIDENIDMPIQSEESNQQKQQQQSSGGGGGGDQGVQTQVNLLSSSLANTTSIAIDAQTKSNNILSQINQLKAELKKAPND
jgi:hypothetical protein